MESSSPVTPIVAKLMANGGTQKALGYKRDEVLLMWALDLQHLAATLAVALTAFEDKGSAGKRLIDELI
jgi:hypothetical protein